ncbi:phosphoribosylglycinamide formyltransferase [Acuticoccus sp.]|uniref:phosphoribosylglycinamide formyltransferase n=1 Tax=Acuticoccus sp. TaxID=1904378 RepID=UPI003B51F11B
MPHLVRGADGKVPVAVFLSGRGTNLAALAAAAAEAAYPARIAVVVSDRPDAGGLTIARSHAIATSVVSRRDYAVRDEFDAALGEVAVEAGAELIALAGFMRILGAPFVARWRDRILNIHPSLLPALRGLDTHARALAAGAGEHGATVHLVTEALDDGPILAQVRVPILPEDDSDRLAARVLAAEHALYPGALAAYIEQKVEPFRLPQD